MKCSQLLGELEHKTNYDIEEIEIENVTTKLELISKNTLFVIISGINFDTGKIIKYIEEKSPAAVVCDRDWGVTTSIPQIFVKNARAALSILYSKYWDEYTTNSTITACNGKICYGHALSETANWYNQRYVFLGGSQPWLLRGGYYDGASTAGLFNVYPATGGIGNVYSFRSTLAVNYNFNMSDSSSGGSSSGGSSSGGGTSGGGTSGGCNDLTQLSCCMQRCSGGLVADVSTGSCRCCVKGSSECTVIYN